MGPEFRRRPPRIQKKATGNTQRERQFDDAWTSLFKTELAKVVNIAVEQRNGTIVNRQLFFSSNRAVW